jgi:hypothetical protein
MLKSDGAIQCINLNRHLAEFTTPRMSAGTNEKQNHGRTESCMTAGETVIEALLPSREVSPAAGFSNDSVRS